jgi:hypothetical protein
MSLAAALFCCAAIADAAWAHDGEDPGTGGHGPTANLERVRAEAASGRFELLAVAVASGELVLYLDRFATNAPVDGARIDVQTPDGPATAAPDGPGTWRLKAPWLARAGRHALIATVTADGEADVLPLMFAVPQPASRPTAARRLLSPPSLATMAGALGAVALIGAVVILRRRRRSI